MAETNVNDQHQPMPDKIERRLAELMQMGEFGEDDIAHCRRTYWTARADWHQILMDCYEAAIQRQQGGVSTVASTPPAPAPRAARPLPQGAPA